MKRRIAPSAASAIALLSSVAACGHHEAAPPLPERAAVTVPVTAAHEELVPNLHLASGTVRGRSTAILTSKTTGYVRQVAVRSGDRVAAGQRLVELEANDVRASVARARAALGQTHEAKLEAESALLAARATARLAKTSYDRAAALFADKTIPQQQFDEAEARWQSARAHEQMAEARIRTLASSIEAAQAGLGEASANLGYADIVAPFAGRVLDRRVDPGALASPGAPLLVLADESGLRVEAAVDESLASDVKLGDEVDVSLDALPKPIVGKVGEIVPDIDVASRAFLVKIDLPEEAARVRSGTYSRVAFHVGATKRLVVPTGALSQLGALERVFVLQDGRARLRMITRGQTSGPWTEILTGLSVNEEVVAAPPADLRDGARVNRAATEAAK